MPSTISFLRNLLLCAASLQVAESSLALALIRGPVIGRPGDASVAVSWITDLPADSRVDYALDGGPWASVRSSDSVTRHAVAITGLESGVVYWYQVFSDDMPLADIATFRAPRESSETSFRFAVIGDTATGKASERSVPAQIADRLLESDVDLVLHAGDIVYPSGDEKDYDAQFFHPFSRWLLHGPVLPALGNHDIQTSHGAPFLAAFVLPSNGVTHDSRFYSLRQANALFVCLDVESSDFGRGSRQDRWLVKTLRESTATWKLVFFHEPPYSSAHPNQLVRLVLCPLFEHYGVDVVFSGHAHLYERTFPMHDFVRSGRGVVYITEGGGGSPLSSFHTQSYTAFIAARHGYTEVQIDGGKLLLLAHDPDGAVFDSFVIEKP